MILAMAHGVGPSNDAPHLLTLKRRASRNGMRDERRRPIWVTLADSSFDSRTIGPHDIVPPIRRVGSLQALERKARVDLVSQAHLEGLRNTPLMPAGTSPCQCRSSAQPP